MKTPSLKEHLQQLHDAQRRRIERLESRYAQLEQAFDQTDSLMLAIPTIANAEITDNNSKDASQYPSNQKRAGQKQRRRKKHSPRKPR